jgi:predicted O-methyltransferase YrrM
MAGMLPLLEEILRKGEVRSAEGTPIKLHSAITAAEGAFLQQLIAQKRPEVSLEIGLAFGVSALFICEGLSKAGGKRHIVIDPSQESGWHGIGLRHLREAGFEPLIEFYQQESQSALPNLVAEGVRIDFAFIDGWHTFDHVLVDFFYIDRLLRVGGVVAFDDASWPAIHRVCRYIATNRQYRFCGEVGGRKSKRLAEHMLCWLSRRSATVRRIVRSKFSEPDDGLGFSRDSDLIAFEKISDDTRSWDFDRDF